MSPCLSSWIFQSTLPARGATFTVRITATIRLAFQSTLPARGATPPTPQNIFVRRFQSTLPARGATENFSRFMQTRIKISIHAPRTGSDRSGASSSPHAIYFNPRSPHGERHLVMAKRGLDGIISIHAPRTGSDAIPSVTGGERKISIHAPRTGSDASENHAQGNHHISIHAPRTGSDTVMVANPLLPPIFQSTLPARGATRTSSYICICGRFQSTLPARGATTAAYTASTALENFNPRSPHGERPIDALDTSAALAISIHAPRTGSDVWARRYWTATKRFQSTLPARGAT